MKTYLLVMLLVGHVSGISSPYVNKAGESSPFPIQFSVPEAKIVKEIPKKRRDFAHIIPGQFNTYIYSFESGYYRDYQQSYYAITTKKGGWDCLRHYEILANGCIPYFIDLDDCPINTMYSLPKELIKEAMNLEGVSYLKIDHEKFNRKKYDEILNKLLEHTRKYLTTKNMAEYLLKKVDYFGTGSILYLSQDLGPDYLRCLMLAGLKELLGKRVIDVPKIEHIYTNYPLEKMQSLLGKGMTYTRVVEDLPIDRENIEQRILNKEFDLIIYGSIHRGLLFHDLVLQNYESEKIVYICGEDDHSCKCGTLPILFIRESSSLVP
ncbi:MAG: hypothetical protein V4489_09175 [Chlamydiota bacterium]